jgi:hypothetical protein
MQHQHFLCTFFSLQSLDFLSKTWYCVNNTVYSCHQRKPLHHQVALFLPGGWPYPCQQRGVPEISWAKDFSHASTAWIVIYFQRNHDSFLGTSQTKKPTGCSLWILSSLWLVYLYQHLCWHNILSDLGHACARAHTHTHIHTHIHTLHHSSYCELHFVSSFPIIIGIFLLHMVYRKIHW